MRPSVRPLVALISETTWLRMCVRPGVGPLQGSLSMQLKIYLPIF
jgi:hypothetical protein